MNMFSRKKGRCYLLVAYQDILTLPTFEGHQSTPILVSFACLRNHIRKTSLGTSSSAIEPIADRGVC